MSSFTPEQCRAARALLNWSQSQLAGASTVSTKTIADFERGSRAPYYRTLADIQRALESAGVEFTNGEQPGVRLKRQQDSQADLKLQINHMQGRVSFDEPTGPASPKRGMQQLRGAKSKNELVKLKNRRTRLDRREKK
jgi:transcriptional regulator with XRE-family HTH domain